MSQENEYKTPDHCPALPWDWNWPDPPADFFGHGRIVSATGAEIGRTHIAGDAAIIVKAVNSYYRKRIWMNRLKPANLAKAMLAGGKSAETALHTFRTRCDANPLVSLFITLNSIALTTLGLWKIWELLGWIG
jgi:hypothetical protein